MRIVHLFFIFTLYNSLFSQSKINILDENTTTKTTTVIYKSLDGSVFELNGSSNWTGHKVKPGSEGFAAFVNAKKPLIVQYETIQGAKYSTVNGGNWNKEQNNYVLQGPIDFVANYNYNKKILDVTFRITNYSLVEITLHPISDPNIIQLYSKYENIGYHKIELPLKDIPLGEYVVVLRTPQRAETVNLSIIE